MQLIKELTQTHSVLWEGDIDGHHFEIHEDIVDGVSDLRFIAEGALLRKVSKAAKKNPLTTAVIGLSLAGIAAKAYNTNKRHTTHFYAKNPHEKRMYATIVKELMATGNYKLKKDAKYFQGGYLWELKRTRSP